MSLANARHVVAALPASDIERAKRFYSDKLGLQPTEQTPMYVQFEMPDGTTFQLFPSYGQPSGTHTQLGFVVDNVQAEVIDLRNRGVQFEEYDFAELKTVDGIAEAANGRAAWFKDTEGNVLGLFEQPVG